MVTHEAEYAVVGSILLDSRCLSVATDILAESDFACAPNRAIFRAAVELDEAGKVIDPVTILAQAKGEVSAEYLKELMIITPTAANIEAYAAEVRKASMRRGLTELADRLNNAITADDPGEVIARARTHLDNLEASDTSRDLTTSGELMAAFFRHRKQVDETGGGFIQTSFNPLNKMLGGGLLNGGLYLLAARPGMGKTSLGLFIGDYVAKDMPVLFVSLEMSEEQIAGRRLSRETEIPYDQLMMGQLSRDNLKSVAEESVRLERRTLYVNKSENATVADIRTMARRIPGLKLIVIDYFGLLTHGKANSRDSLYEKATETSRQLKLLAKSLGIPILCLAQLNRSSETRSDKKPKPSDLRDTGALEQDADAIIFLHQPNKSENETVDAGKPQQIKIIVAKNRHGQTGVCDAAFFPATGRFTRMWIETAPPPEKNKQAKTKAGQFVDLQEDDPNMPF